MLYYTLKRLALAALVALTVSFISFGLLYLSSDPAIAMAGETASDADIEAIRQLYGFDRPILVQYFDWLQRAAAGDLGIEYHIENDGDRENQRGIGGGIDLCVSNVKTEFVNILHSDFWLANNQDIELLKLYDDVKPGERLIASSFRVQPNIFPNDPPYRPGTIFVPFDEFGVHDTDFDGDHFDNWSNEFTKDNDIQNGSKFAAKGMQIAAGVPLACDEPEEFKTFRLGLFGLDKLYDVEGTFKRLTSVLDQVL